MNLEEFVRVNCEIQPRTVKSGWFLYQPNCPIIIPHIKTCSTCRTQLLLQPCTSKHFVPLLPFIIEGDELVSVRDALLQSFVGIVLSGPPA